MSFSIDYYLQKYSAVRTKIIVKKLSGRKLLITLFHLKLIDFLKTVQPHEKDVSQWYSTMKRHVSRLP